MTIIVNARPVARFIEIKGNLKRNKLYRMNQGYNFLRDRLRYRDNFRAPVQFKGERQCQHYK